ncbi:MAG: tetratricopeptide repeat protein, partial [Ktedonobacteraceae bacterium]|nr:tetratricopeptide repeat protein [Ktedonobacteraceae bacterium]
MPGNRQVFSTALNAADRHRWDSQWREAMLEYQKALAEFPEDPTARGGMGFCYMQTKQWQQALREYEYILKRDPGNVIALSKTAELYGLLNRREDAYGAYLHLADLYSQAGQGARAEAAWQKAVQLSPGNPEPHERLAGYYFEKKDIAAMIHERLAAAQGYLLGNHLGQARVQCEEVLRADARNVQAQQLLTQILGPSGRTSGPLPSGSGAMFSIEAGGNAANPANISPAGGYESSNSQPLTGNSVTEIMTSGNTSGGNTGIMGNMGSAGNFGGASNSGPSLAAGGPGNSMNSAPRKRLSASQVTGVLKQAQTFQTQGRFNDAIDLCEQILESGFDRPDARYFLGWLYQEQQRWDEAIRQFQLLLNDPDYALSCYYALGQCYRARGDLRTATVHFDEAVDRVNLDALTVEESDQLVQLCQEAAEAHRLLGEQEQALTVYNALLGFLRSRGWADKVAQVEFMLQQAQNASAPARPVTPPVTNTRPAPPEPMANTAMPDAATMAFNVNNIGNGSAASPLPAQQSLNGNSSVGDLPDWLTGILSDGDKTQAPNKPASPQSQQMQQTQVVPAPPEPRRPSAPLEASAQPASPSWLTEDAKAANSTRVLPPDQMPVTPPQPVPSAQPAPSPLDTVYPIVPPASNRPAETRPAVEDLLTQIAGGKGENLGRVAEVVLTSTASLPENIRLQVVRSMQDIQNYINHGLLSTATEECLRVIDMAPQYLDVHQVLCEIYVRQGQIEQAITKYGILVDTYIVNGRTDDAIATYRRILQLEPNNLTYR